MSDSALGENGMTARTRTPWQVWAVGILALLWNAIGAFDYVMTQTRNPSYLASFTPEQLAYFNGFPAWVTAAWALAVWGGVAGSILLLIRNRLAVPVFLGSLIAMLVTTLHNYVLSNALEIFPETGPKVFTVIIFAVSLALYLHARKLEARGVLR